LKISKIRYPPPNPKKNSFPPKIKINNNYPQNRFGWKRIFFFLEIMTPRKIPPPPKKKKKT